MQCFTTLRSSVGKSCWFFYSMSILSYEWYFLVVQHNHVSKRIKRISTKIKWNKIYEMLLSLLQTHGNLVNDSPEYTLSTGQFLVYMKNCIKLYISKLKFDLWTYNYVILKTEGFLFFKDFILTLLVILMDIFFCHKILLTFSGVAQTELREKQWHAVLHFLGSTRTWFQQIHTPHP